MLIVDRVDIVPYYFCGTISSVLRHQTKIKLKGAENLI